MNTLLIIFDPPPLKTSKRRSLDILLAKKLFLLKSPVLEQEGILRIINYFGVKA
jgi:hypothetical protein